MLFTLLLSAAAAAEKPNFLVLFVDDMGIDQIEVPESQRQYGMTGNNGTISTPHISRLASEGLVFQVSTCIFPPSFFVPQQPDTRIGTAVTTFARRQGRQ